MNKKTHTGILFVSALALFGLNNPAWSAIVTVTGGGKGALGADGTSGDPGQTVTTGGRRRT